MRRQSIFIGILTVIMVLALSNVRAAGGISNTPPIDLSPPANNCGNGVINTGEQCDGANLNGKTCLIVSENYGGGTLKCALNCQFDTTGCTAASAYCGNKIKDGNEQCDGADFGGATCMNMNSNYVGGVLSCTANCELDYTTCLKRPNVISNNTNGTGNTGTNIFLKQLQQIKDKLETRFNVQTKIFDSKIKRLSTDIVKLNQKIENDKTMINQVTQQKTDLSTDYQTKIAALTTACVDVASTACKDAMNMYKSEMGVSSNRLIESALEHISQVKTKLQTNPYIDSTVQTAILAKLNQQIIALNALRSSSDKTVVSSAISDTRMQIKIAQGALSMADFNGVLQRLTMMSGHFHEASQEIAAEGKDVTKLNNDINSFDNKITSTSASYSVANSNFAENVKTVAQEKDADTLIKNSKAQLKTLKGTISGARKDLTNIIQDIKKLNEDVLQDTANNIAADTVGQ